MKKKKGFTLVELLAVIVILAVILIIAMPKISDVIKNSKEASLETTAKLIASQAEKKYTENQVLDGSSTIKCSDVAKINDADYESCNITFDDKGNAKVSIVGKGKFEGMAVCNANKNSASISSDCATNANYFSYVDIPVVTNVIVEDANKCKNYLQTLGAPEERATTLCTTEDGLVDLKELISYGDIPSSDYETAGLRIEEEDVFTITGYQFGTVSNVEVKNVEKCKSYLQSKFTNFNEGQATTLCTTNQAVGSLNLQQAVSKGFIPLIDYETAGLKVTYENGGGKDVVIPSQIDGKKVGKIEANAFKGAGNFTITNNSSIPNTQDVWDKILGIDGSCSPKVTITNNIIEIGVLPKC